MSSIEFIVSIPSYMEADSISFVAKQVDLGITKHFGNLNSIIINVDNNSEDNTKSAFLSTETITPKHYISTPKGVRGKGNNLLNLFKYADKHKDSLKGVVVVDADLRSITPEWIKYLGEPLLIGYDYVLPRYSRHQFDATITNHICYPLLFSLLGRDLRQPIGGEFGFSPGLMNHWLKQEWSETPQLYGIDIFMTLHAIFGDFMICEAGLGAKIHKASAPKLGPMFVQVISTLFEILISRQSEWIEAHSVKPKEKKQFGLKELAPPQELEIDMREIKDKLRSEYCSREKILKKYLNEFSFKNLKTMIEHDHYHLDILMWTQVVFQLLYAYRNSSSKTRKEIIDALMPLYLARTVTFDYQTWRYNANYVEDAILDQAKAFASQRPYFLGLGLKG